jgi:phage regulator Rha-like protein
MSSTTKKAKAPGRQTQGLKENSTNTADFALATTAKQERRADTRLMARELGTTHKSLFELVRKYTPDFEALGKVPFQTEALPSGQSERFALLNEDQAYLLLTYSRNTAKVRHLKVKLVQAFRDARRAAELRQTEYLPAHHRLHEAIKIAAAGSPNERWMHVNANKALNRLAGIGAGQRATAGPLTQSLLAVGAALAAKAVLDTQDGHGVQARIRAALMPLANVLALPERS